MREGGRLNLPAMRRGLSPEGCRIRERHSQGSLTIGVQGVTVHPAERASRSQSSFLQENVRRLREIQAKCRDREQPSRRHQPLRATTRVSSASTTASTLSKTDGPVDASLVKTGEGGAGRGDSAHSDYYSLSEDPPDPPLPTHPHYPPQGWPANTSSRPQSPVVLRPLATSPLPPHESDQHPLLPDAGLTREMRRLRMESLVSRISSQRPACEMDYHQHYRTIENQHRQLLDAVERINSSSGDAGSGEDSTRSRGTQVRAATPPRMVRAHSFDRSTQARRREGSAERTKAGASGELKALKKFHHRSSSPSPSSSFSSPQPARSSRIISKSGRLLQDTGEGKGVAGRQAMGLKSTAMTESISKDESRGKRGLLRAKSELGRASPDIRPSGTRPPSCHGSLWSNVRQDAADAASFSEDTNLNSTLSSSCDFYPGDHIEAESPRRATREDLKLAIRPDSQSTTAEGSHGAKDPNQNDWDSYNDLDFPQNSAVDAEDAAIYSGAVAGTKHSEPPDSKAEVTVGEKITNAGEDRKIDDPGGVDETDDVHRAQALATPTPVQHTGEDDTAAVATAVTTTTNSPRRLKREQQQPRRTRGDLLRRSQSLKNVAHTPPSYQIGKIPRYLQIRKEEKRRQEELARAVDPDCPPGHQPLPDHERLNTLHLLHKSQTQVLRELSSLPVAQDTLRIKKVRLTLEEKLTQIEEGLRIFSQPRVYIMNDD